MFSAVMIAVVLLFGLFAGATVAGRVVVEHSVNDLSNRVLVAQQSAAALLRAYVDQETGQRGFLLTGDPAFLQPYTTGLDRAARQQIRLRRALAGDAQSMTALDAVSAAADDWETTAARPEIAARTAGPVPGDQMESFALVGKGLFDTLRDRAAALTTRTNALAAHKIQRVHSAQRFADIATYISAGLLLAIVAAAFLALPGILARPVARLLEQVRTVSEGDYAVEIERAGPVEIATIADAVNHMRNNLLASIDARLAAERALALRDEQSRMAAELHDRTIGRVFGLGLSLASLTSRHPRLASGLEPLIAETDTVIAELRKSIFDLKNTVD